MQAMGMSNGAGVETETCNGDTSGQAFNLVMIADLGTKPPVGN